MSLDLSGSWRGIFNYPSLLPSTEFEAELRDSGGALSGLTTEPNLAFGGSGTLHAVIEGTREDRRVRFRKTYDELRLAADVVHYEGTVQPGDDEIAGEWTLPGNWSGTFIMIRGPRTGEAAERRVSEQA